MKLWPQFKTGNLVFQGFQVHIMGLFFPIFMFLTYFLWIEFGVSTDTLTVNQSIRSSEVLMSKREIFKFGFFSTLNGSHYYVGVMYYVPVLTVVWIANRDKPLNDSDGRVEISENGNLVILDGRKGVVVWSSNHSGPVGNYNATLLDNGNLVLQDILSGRIVWQSFQHASDSFLQKMKMTTNSRINGSNMLRSWSSPSDPAVGSYTAALESLQIPQIVVRKDADLYWRSGPWNGQSFIGLSCLDNYVYKNGIDIVNENPEVTYMTFSYTFDDLLSYYALDSSGILQHKSWSAGNNDWEVIWSSRQSVCDIYGKCGPFGICNPHATPICTCFPGFVPKNIDEWNAENWTRGCMRKTPGSCEKNTSVGETGKQDEFFTLEKVKLPDNAIWLPSLGRETCGSECLNNCSCIAYAVYIGIGCMLWIGTLTDVQKFSTGRADLQIRLAHSELVLLRSIPGSRIKVKIIATATVVGFIIIVVSSCFLCEWCYKGSIRKQLQLLITRFGERNAVADDSKQNLLKHKLDGVNLEEFPFFEFQILVNATNNFDPIYKLGQGGFGPVYRGKLSNGQEIAVKRLASSSNQGLEEFKNEVEVISKLQHRNLVKLLGFCAECEEKMLVYEYMPNGSLDAYLFDSQKEKFLDWNKRMAIIEGISRGLLYLHRDSRLRIIHRDLKASNILLDEELNPKISDFGIARIFRGKENQANTRRIVGTFGYMAPEYVIVGRFSEKSDVFSFGVLLLEIVSGRRNNSFYNDDSAQNLIAYAWKLWNEENLINLMDPLIYDPDKKSEVLRCANVGLLCVQKTPQDRPNISSVLFMLSSDIMELPRPKMPAYTAYSSSLQTEPPEIRQRKLSVNDITMTSVEGR